MQTSRCKDPSSNGLHDSTPLAQKVLNPTSTSPESTGQAPAEAAARSRQDLSSLPPRFGFQPVLIQGRQILSPEILGQLAAPLPPLPVPKPWLEAKAMVGEEPEKMKQALSSYWESDSFRQSLRISVVGARKSVEVLKSFSGNWDRGSLSDWVENRSIPATSSSGVGRWVSKIWQVTLLSCVFFASLSNGAKLVLLARHRLFDTTPSALLLSAIFSIAPVIVYEWSAHQMAPKNRRRLDRVLQIAAVPCVLIGLVMFAFTFAGAAQNPLVALASGTPPADPNWALILLCNLVVEMFAEIGLWSRLRESSHASLDLADSTGTGDTDFKVVETRTAELEALEARLNAVLVAMQREQESWVEEALIFYESKRALLVANEMLQKAKIQAKLASLIVHSN